MAENTEKKPGFFAKIKRYLKDSSGEMKKIVWPGVATVRNHTGIVILVVAIAAVVVGCLDIVATQLIQLFAQVL